MEPVNQGTFPLISSQTYLENVTALESINFDHFASYRFPSKRTFLVELLFLTLKLESAIKHSIDEYDETVENFVENANPHEYLVIPNMYFELQTRNQVHERITEVINRIIITLLLSTPTQINSINNTPTELTEV